jgi:putative sugar O-methyltransferase
MRLKLEHLRHPFRTATVAKDLVATRLSMRRCADSGERRFRGDPRYALESVTAGFASGLLHVSEHEQRRRAEPDDAALLERICTAYIKSAEREASASPTYRATAWWEEVRRHNLKLVMQALLNRDVEALHSMYSDFLRDPCSAGLIGLPWSGRSFGDASSDLYRRFYLSDVLHRLEHWTAQTGGRFPLRNLAGPGIGNPFGVLIEGTLIRSGSEYHHYCAQRIIDLLAALPDPARATVVEIGGGFGDMAWYLLRDRPGMTYINFDLPESIALASYYLLKSFPERTFLLYGEVGHTHDSITPADVVLMPAFELAAQPGESANLTFCSHLMSDISPAAMTEYLDQIARITRDYFLYVGSNRSGERIFDSLRRGDRPFTLADARRSEWQKHRAPNWDEVECTYRAASASVSRAESAALVEN